MTRIERNVMMFVHRHLTELFLSLVFAVGMMMRWLGRGFLAGDMARFLIPWFDEIKESGGLQGLSQQVGDYGLLYQTLISLMTYIDLPNIYQYKLLSIAFDIVLAATACVIVSNGKLTTFKTGGVNAFALVFLLPTVVLNSAFWGQCDSMFSVFAVATLGFLYKDHPRKAFVFLGLAFACKLQAVFILPFILVYYMKTQKFSIFYLLLSVATMWLTGMVAFCYGRSLLAPLTIYHSQTFEYQQMFLNFPSFWVLAGNNYATLKWFSVGIALAVCAIGACAFLRDTRDAKTTFWPMATWFVWTLVLFLPSMHERYAYLLDILLVILACMDKRFARYAAVAVCASLWTYGNYLFDRVRDTQLAFVAVVFVAAYLHYSLTIFKTKE